MAGEGRAVRSARMCTAFTLLLWIGLLLTSCGTTAPKAAPAIPEKNYAFFSPDVVMGHAAAGGFGIDLDLPRRAIYESQIVDSGSSEQVVSTTGSVAPYINEKNGDQMLKINAAPATSTTDLIVTGRYLVVYKSGGLGINVPTLSSSCPGGIRITQSACFDIFELHTLAAYHAGVSYMMAAAAAANH